MNIETDGTLALLPTQSRDIDPSFDFWWRHRGLFDDAGDLWLQVAGVSDLCQRFLTYVSTDLYWVTRDRASPIAADAFAAGLASYRAARVAPFDIQSCSLSLNAHNFLEGVLDHAAARLSSVMLLSGEDSWSAVVGEPLQPWLSRRSRDIVLRIRRFSDVHEQPARAAMYNYILDRRDTDNFDLTALY